jgi:hypothetical protein
MFPNTGSSSPPQTTSALFSTTLQAHGATDGVARSSSAPGTIRTFNAARRLEPRFLPLATQTQAQADPDPDPNAIDWQYSDCHFHPTSYIQEGRTAAELVADMNQLRIRYATMMPIPTNVLSSQPDPSWKPLSGRHHCGPDYYLPPRLTASRTLREPDIGEACQATELYMNTGVDATTALRYRQLPADARKRLDPMVTGLHIGDMHSSTYLLQKLHDYPGVFTGVGEITVHKEVVEQLFAGKRQANLDANVAPLCKLLETCGGIGMPVVLHCDITSPLAKPGDAPAYLAGLQRLFTDPAVSATTIVWAHAGGLGRFVDAPDGHRAALGAMLADSRYDHVRIDLSWLVVAEKLVASSESMAQWVELIEAFPTRFLYGSDALAPKDPASWGQTYAKYQALMPLLSPACRTRVCLGNYLDVFVAARKKVRAFERYMLPGIIADMQKQFTTGCGAQPGAVASVSAVAASLHEQVVLPSPEKQRQ